MGGRLQRIVMAVVAAALLTLMTLLGGTSPAFAHNSFTGSDPADGAELSRPPASVRLTFLSRPNPKTTKILVTGPDGRSAARGAPVYSKNGISVPFRAGGAGQYLVAYRITSNDGHPIEGSIRFTLTAAAVPSTAVPSTAGTSTPGASGSPAANAAASGVPTMGAPSPTLVPRPETVSDDQADGGAWWPVVLGGALIVFGAVGAFYLRRRARR